MKPTESPVLKFSTSTTPTIQQAIAEAVIRLEKCGLGYDNATVDARTLLLYGLGASDFSSLIINRDEIISEVLYDKFCKAIRKRESGMPIAYIIGYREFYGRRFKTTPVALIPRCETELLVDLTLQFVPEQKPMRVLDLGTGCGAIAISIALERPSASLVATDCEASTLALAKKNATAHSVNNIAFYQADWFSGVPFQPFDLIVSNPPYIPEDDEHLNKGDCRFEPKIALASGKDGLTAFEHIIQNASAYLKRGGVLMVENGYNQSKEVIHLMAKAGFCGGFHVNDLMGHERVGISFLP